MQRKDIRLALPSKGVLAEETLVLLANAGLKVYKPNPRQYQATIPALPGVTVLFQRPGDIVVSVRDGSVDFGITGWDVVGEYGVKDEDRGPSPFEDGAILPLLDDLGFGQCSLNVIVPEENQAVQRMEDLKKWQDSLGRPLRIATKFTNLARGFLKKHQLEDSQLLQAEGTLEIAPTIGYADLIIDLVSTGTTLRDNRLRKLEDGLVLKSQACLVANRAGLANNPKILETARSLIEYIVAHLRAVENVSVFANVRGASAEAIARAMFSKSIIGGLQGPTIAPIYTRDGDSWFDIHIIVRKDLLPLAIRELREVGGSGVVVTPVTYIFEEEPLEYRQMLAALNHFNKGAPHV